MSTFMAFQEAAHRQRLLFIDLLRAFAILMMLQGHFIDTTLAESWRDKAAYPLYSYWAFMRGLTAPVFFFSSGLVFVFLLLRERGNAWANKRAVKGARRGLQLILTGYLLRLSFPALLHGRVPASFFYVDVLHCIGIALLGLVFFYVLSHYLRLPFPLWLALAGGAAFFFYFDVKEADYAGWPVALQHYFHRELGAVFTPVPWVGFSFMGGILGWLLHWRPSWAFGHALPVALLAMGYLTDHYSSNWLIDWYEWTGLEQFRRHAYFNFLLKRLGEVWIVAALFIWLAKYWQTVPRLVLKIGGETLAIYEVHFVVLYGTWFGLGISTIWAYQLNPWQAVAGALLFVLAFVIFTAYLDRIGPVRWAWWGRQFQRAYRLSRWQWYRLRSRGQQVLP
ncbi:DUF1624 domain-containing protein [Phaeodactylibacter luteus]|uniref:DUF1624 domain-containing protein n=2 Tax=Phaeodactylibacter luteus TaxID=1564516 RepID=A0A5C6S7W1_9BACT|nr:DUF1624 domain-containing protein [Phaeodactylibacter luteus]